MVSIEKVKQLRAILFYVILCIFSSIELLLRDFSCDSSSLSCVSDKIDSKSDTLVCPTARECGHFKVTLSPWQSKLGESNLS